MWANLFILWVNTSSASGFLLHFSSKQQLLTWNYDPAFNLNAGPRSKRYAFQLKEAVHSRVKYMVFQWACSRRKHAATNYYTSLMFTSWRCKVSSLWCVWWVSFCRNAHNKICGFFFSLDGYAMISSDLLKCIFGKWHLIPVIFKRRQTFFISKADHKRHCKEKYVNLILRLTISLRVSFLREASVK